VRLFRDVGSVTLDFDGVETVRLRTLGGADNVTLNDLAGTAVTSVHVDLASFGGGGDAQPDGIFVNGTIGDDSIVVASDDAGGVNVTGLAAAYLITGAEGGVDALMVQALAGIDTLRFNGSGANENIDLSANGLRVRLFRDVGSVTLDFDGVETVRLRTLGGADNVTLNDLAGTAVTSVHVDLASFGGGGDAQPDGIFVNGTNGDDVIVVAGDAAGLSVMGLAAALDITGAEAGVDTLTVQALAGDDVVDASGVAAGAISLAIFGGADEDVLIGGPGGDLMAGGPGADIAFLGAGNDTFEWNPGDGSDVVLGEAGSDTLLFNGSGANENIAFSATGLSRDVGSVTLNFDGVETVRLRTLGGADAVTLHDLAGTAMTGVHVDLAGVGGGGDAASDVVLVYGTAGTDVIVVAGDAAGINVTGLAAAYRITGAEAVNDTLIIDALGGIDAVDSSGLAPNVIDLIVLGVP
jgi:hypothetical protein